MNCKSTLLALPLVLLSVAAISAIGARVGSAGSGRDHGSPRVFHPHFPKTLECRISRELTLTVRYQTVTFDADGARKMTPGQSWHLAGATVETTQDLIIGGQPVPAGNYALSARKTEGESWQLLLHEGRGFSRPKGDALYALKTRLQADAPLCEHLNIDVQPTGDKEHTRLFLAVGFDCMLASALIELPE